MPGGNVVRQIERDHRTVFGSIHGVLFAIGKSQMGMTQSIDGCSGPRRISFPGLKQ